MSEIIKGRAGDRKTWSIFKIQNSKVQTLLFRFSCRHTSKAQEHRVLVPEGFWAFFSPKVIKTQCYLTYQIEIWLPCHHFVAISVFLVDNIDAHSAVALCSSLLHRFSFPNQYRYLYAILSFSLCTIIWRRMLANVASRALAFTNCPHVRVLHASESAVHEKGKHAEGWRDRWPWITGWLKWLVVFFCPVRSTDY